MESSPLTNLCVQPEEFIYAIDNRKQPVLSFFHMNVRSMLSKVDDIEILLDTIRSSFSVLMFSETWYTSDSNDFVLPNYEHFSIRRNTRRGGGVSMLVESTLNCCIIPDFTELNDSFELLSVLCDNYVFSVLYRPPAGNVNILLSVLDKLFSYVNDNNYTLFLGGDFNIDLLKTTAMHDELFSVVESNGYECITTDATRITENSCTLLDYFITNCNHEDIYASGLISCNISDHLPIFLLVNNHVSACKHKSQGFRIRNMTSQRMQSFRDLIGTADWDPVYASASPDAAYKTFLETFQNIYNKCFPYKFIKPSKRAKKPWVSHDLLKKVQIKNSLYHKFIKSKDNHDFVKFKTYRNKLNALMKKTKQEYYCNLFGNIRKNDPDKLWKNITAS